MPPSSQRFFWPFSWRQGLLAMLAAASMGLVLWVGWLSWICPQPPANSSANRLCLSPGETIPPLCAALGFWLVGPVAWLAVRKATTALFFFLAAAVLASGLSSSMGSYAGGRLFYALLAWLAPLSFGFYLSLLGRPPAKAEGRIRTLLWTLAAALSAPFLVNPIGALQAQGWYSGLRTAIRLSIGCALAAGPLVLAYAYRRDASLAARRRIRLLAFGALLAFAPALFLSLLPDTLGASGHVPYEHTLPWLLLCPITYVYSLYRDRLVRFEAAFSRATVSYLLLVALFGLYLLAGALVSHPAGPLARSPFAGALLSLLLLLAFAGLQKKFTQVTRWALYGRETAARELPDRLTDALSLTLDRQSLQRLLTEQLASAMRLPGCDLFLKDRGDTLVPSALLGFEADRLADLRLPLSANLAVFLATTARPLAGAEVRRALRGTTLSAAEGRLISLAPNTLWLPLLSGGALQGVLLLEARSRDDFFDAEEQRSLAALARQAGIAAHNVRLVEEVEVARRELARAHRQLLAGRERERRQLAQDLHDGAVQQLIGISYQLANAGRGAGGKIASDEECLSAVEPSPHTIRRELLGVVQQLRGLVSELRPAGLEELGLCAALEGYISHLKREGGADMPVVELTMDQDDAALPDSVSTCLFRVAQEGLRNALRHGQARHIQIILRVTDDEAILQVIDDGCGFRVPARLSELTQSDHFGLVGIAERVAWAGGRFEILSQPDAGTKLTVSIPLDETEQTDD